MTYRVWTNQDLQQYLQYRDRIISEKLGVINIGGIYSKKEPHTQHCASGHVYRIYDQNTNCPHRATAVNSPGAKKWADGSCVGVVVVIAKDDQTGDFFQINKARTVTPAAAWIRRHYTGNIRVVAEQILSEHEQVLHENYCTRPDGMGIQPVLTENHLDEHILPAAIQVFATQIQKADAAWAEKRRKVLDAGVEHTTEHLKNIKK